MMRSSKWLALRGTAVVGALGFLLAGAGELPAQEEECVLAPSGPVTNAAEALEKAMGSDDPEEQAREYRRALNALQGPLDDQTDDPAVHILAAQAQIGFGDYESADRHMDRFEELAPECRQEAHDTRYNAWATAFNEGIQAYQMEDTDAALNWFENASTIYADPRSFNNAALLYQQKGETERALELWREAVATGGEPDQVQSAMDNLTHTLQNQGRADEAIAIYEDYLEEHPDDAVARIRYAMLLQDSDRAEEGAAIFREVMDSEDLDASQWNLVGIGLFDTQSYQEAAEAFARGRQVNPYHKDLMEHLVSASIQAGNPGDVNALADTLVDWFPYDAQAHQLRAHSLSRLGQSPEAMQALQRGEDTPVAFQSIQMGQATPDTWVVQGTLASREAGAGQSLTIPFEFIDLDGNVVATQEVTVQTAPAGQSTTVQLEVTSQEPIAGFRYGEAR